MTKNKTPARKHESATGALLWHHGESTTPQPPSAASVSERARGLLAGAYRVHGHFEYADILLNKPLVGEDYIAAYAIEQALTQQRGECEDARKFRRLAQLLDGFDFRLGRNALMPPATYLDSVEITCEFQPGIGQSVIDAIVDVLTTEKRND